VKPNERARRSVELRRSNASGVMKDRRTKRNRTRGTQRYRAISESREG